MTGYIQTRHSTTMPVDYSKAKIYKIWSPSTDKQYIGSTCDELRKRLSLHKSNYKRYLEGKYRYTTSFEVLQHPDYRIVLIEQKACNNKMEVLRLEADHIRNNDCTNKVIPGALLIAGSRKEYYQNNRDAIRAQKNTKNECECGMVYTQSHKARHEKSKLHQIYLRLTEHNELNHLVDIN